MEKLFYLISERWDEQKYCQRRGLLPYIYEEVEIPSANMTYTKVYKYKSKNYVYTCLQAAECYSGFCVTLMREPEPSCEELISIAQKSKSEDEKLGALGILVKKYPEDLKKYLSECPDKKIIKLLEFIREFNSYSVNAVNNILGDREI